MKNIEFRKDLLLSVQRALLGMIYPEVRAIAIGYEETRFFKIIYYLDRDPDENDYEIVSEVTTEICSDIIFEEFIEICVFNLEPISKLDNLDSWVYVRRETTA